MTDQELYKGIAEKKNDVFQYMYGHYFGAIKNLVLKNSGDQEDALDIFQEGIVAIWMNIQKGSYVLNSNTKISTYLFSVCRNLWFKRLRKSKNVVSLQQDNFEGEVEEYNDNENRFIELEGHFNQLGEKCKNILHQFYYKKSSMKEIAALFNYEEKTAKNEKYRCMKKLRAFYN